MHTASAIAPPTQRKLAPAVPGGTHSVQMGIWMDLHKRQFKKRLHIPVGVCQTTCGTTTSLPELRLLHQKGVRDKNLDAFGMCGIQGERDGEGGMVIAPSCQEVKGLFHCLSDKDGGRPKPEERKEVRRAAPRRGGDVAQLVVEHQTGTLPTQV